MRTITAAVVTAGLTGAALVLAAAPASAACVTYTPGTKTIASVSWPVLLVVRDPGTVSVTPTDCV